MPYRKSRRSYPSSQKRRAVTPHLPQITDPRLVQKLRYKGIDKFIAYEVDLGAVQDRYRHSYETIAKDLVDGEEDLRVLDFNGHQIMANFSLQALGEPVKFEG